MNSSTKSKVFPLLCLLFLGTLCPLDRIDAFLSPNPHNLPSHVDSSSHSYTPTHASVPRHRVVGAKTARSMATVDRSSSSESKNMGKGKQQVLFQKVIRPTQNMPDILFLGYLIEYLERHFELPSDLPMIYESEIVNAEQNEGCRYTLAWDSPLSPSAEATRMEVEVVGIYTDGKKTDESSSSSSSSSVPNMAMVVVRRPESDGPPSKSTLPPMMKGLFDDSEKRIIQALDRGLDDFVAGRIKFDMSDDLAEQRSHGRGIPQNVKTAEEAIEAELVDDYPDQDDAKPPAEDVVFDAYATTDMGDDENNNETKENEPKKSSTTVKQEVVDAKARAMATMQKPAEQTSKKSSSDKQQSDATDFAVVAAKKAAQAARKKTTVKAKESNLPSSDSDTVDFAVAAAKKAAALRKTKKSSSSSSTEDDFAVAAARKKAATSGAGFGNKPKTTASRKAKTSSKVRGSPEVISNETKGPQMEQGPSMPPIPEGWKPRDYFKDQRAFVGTISTPKKIAAKRAALTKKTTSKESVAAKTTVDAKPKASQNSADPKVAAVSKESIGKRKLNAKVIDASLPGDEDDIASTEQIPLDPLLEQAARDDKNIPSQKEIELEIMKAAQTALDEIESQGSNMTPEEMLKDVLKFDEEKKKEEEVGSGFVSGALEKAKELLKDRHRQIQERQKAREQQQQQVGFKEFEKPDVNAFPRYPDPVDEAKQPMTEEEELRAMFAAGSKIANGKIDSKAEAGSLAKKGTTEEDVDRLIAEEKTVSKYARILDDELAELEVRINASPGEELDGPMQNPIFDVMSGPEVYNPNVELDAVNYPGAIPGTADVKLPKQLDEAIKQADFAASVLMSMETKEVKDETTGQTSVKYFSGKKELNSKQVENLQKVVSEAVKAGIIDNPLEVMAEQSRLQLVLDELWHQPEERFQEIVSNYKDLFLSDRFVGLVRERLTVMADRDLDALRRDDESLREPHEREREILGQLVVYAQALLKETRALGAELEATQLEVIRSICKVAMDPAHTTEEETAMALSDAVRDMRPLLDDAFVAYLKYAVAEEEAKLARQGLLDDPDYNQWLFVLKIVQQGVYAEVAKGINRYVEHIWYVIRMETPQQRRKLLERLIDDMPTMDVRPFVQVVDNIVGSLGDGVNGNFDGLVPLGEMTNTLLQLQHDVQELLPPERIAEKSRDADEWAARQKKRLMEQRKIGQQRLQAAREVGHLENDVDAVFGSGGGEVDRFD